MNQAIMGDEKSPGKTLQPFSKIWNKGNREPNSSPSLKKKKKKDLSSYKPIITFSQSYNFLYKIVILS